MAKNTKNTFLSPQSTNPFYQGVPFKNPFAPPKGPQTKFNSRVVTAFRTQNRGGGGK